MQKANPHSELLRMTFKTITHLLREVKSFQMADYHLNIVFNYIRIALDEMDKPNVTFALIKALVWKKVVVSAIYDLMPVLTEMLVQTTSLALRSHCETILVQFLLTYPLGGKRLQQHLDVVISNMGHSFQPGRYAILNLLYNIFQRFPEAVLNDRAEYFFLPLVAQMVNDDSIDCREKAGAALNNLIKHIDVDHRATLLNMALQWYAPKEGVQVRPELQRAASQLLGIFVPHYGGAAYDKFIQRVLPLIKSILQNSPHGDDEEEDANIDSIADTWQLVYFSLVALEKIIQLQPKYVQIRIFMQSTFLTCSSSLQA
jgi:U3 small nucleolar RNA-associated protein 20